MATPAAALRRHARRVSLAATLVSLALFVAAAAVADLLVLHHLEEAASNRLATELTAIRSGLAVPRAASSGDPDDAPVYAWRAGATLRRPVALTAGAPPLSAEVAAALPTDGRSSQIATIAGRRFLVAADRAGGATVVVGTSEQPITNTRNDLLVAEGAVLPVTLLAVFFVAVLIARASAAPIERARRQQLEFAADASHELRTPLSVIEAELGLALSAERPAAGYRQALQRVSGETARLRAIVDELMLLVRADAPGAAPPAEVLPLVPAVREAAQRFAPLLAGGGGTLRIEAAEDAAQVAVRIAPEWLERLVSVLVDNAVRHAGVGGQVLVAVRCAARSVILRVEDSGPGIPLEERELVLRRFHRSDSSRGGAGLGLAIADAIVAASDGALRIGDSVLGGALVEVRWPPA